MQTDHANHTTPVINTATGEIPFNTDYSIVGLSVGDQFNISTDGDRLQLSNGIAEMQPCVETTNELEYRRLENQSTCGEHNSLLLKQTNGDENHHAMIPH